MDPELQPNKHEQETIGAFVVRDKRERFLTFLSNSKNRKKFTQELGHFRWFDQRFATPVPWQVDPHLKLWARHVQGIETIFLLLKSKGAGKTCWVISENPGIDGKELDLKKTLEEVVGRGTGTILSCVPGKLAYFEGEDERLLLVR